MSCIENNFKKMVLTFLIAVSTIISYKILSIFFLVRIHYFRAINFSRPSNVKEIEFIFTRSLWGCRSLSKYKWIYLFTKEVNKGLTRKEISQGYFGNYIQGLVAVLVNKPKSPSQFKWKNTWRASGKNDDILNWKKRRRKNPQISPASNPKSVKIHQEFSRTFFPISSGNNQFPKPQIPRLYPLTPSIPETFQMNSNHDAASCNHLLNHE